MARVVHFYQTGGPEVLKIDEIPTPEPGAGEVRIKVRALGLNRAESMYRSGRYVIEPKFPAKLGYEAAGTIDAIGDNVSGLAVGDSVSVIPAFMFDQYGMYGDLVVAPARAVVKNPEGLDWASAAVTWMPFVTAWGALIDIANLGKGDFVVLPAAASSVALAAIQIAHHVGATPIALVRKASKAEGLRTAGVKHILEYGQVNITEEIMRITEGKGARVVFDPVGGPDFEHLVKATSNDAFAFIYGALSHEATSVPVLHVLGKHTTIRGYEFIEVTSDDIKLDRAKAFIIEGLRAGHFRPEIAKTFRFDEIVEAHCYLESNAQFGKIVVTVD